MIVKFPSVRKVDGSWWYGGSKAKNLTEVLLQFTELDRERYLKMHAPRVQPLTRAQRSGDGAA